MGQEVFCGLCCDLHNRHCEPPSELCCSDCSEVQHPDHPPGTQCVLSQVVDPVRSAMQKVTVRHPQIPCPAPALPPGQQQDVTQRMEVVHGQFVVPPLPLWCPGCRCQMEPVKEEWIVNRVAGA